MYRITILSYCDMNDTTSSGKSRSELRDFSADPRLMLLIGMALVVGTAGAGAAWLLLRLINFFTNLAYYGRLSTATASIPIGHLGLSSVLIPVAGCFVIGLMARFGSSKIR